MKRKIALFDFDKTVIAKDSILILYEKTAKKKPGFRRNLYRHCLGHVFAGRRDDLKKAIKEEFLSMIGHYTPAELKAFVKDNVMAYAFEEAIEEIRRLKAEGYYLMLVSASAQDYLQYIKDFLPFDHIIGTETDAEYRIVGENNKHAVKVDNILAHLTEKSIEIDYDNSVAYSDSLSADRPMLELVKHRYLINATVIPEGYTKLSWSKQKAYRR